jgi:hypothetical protein
LPGGWCRQDRPKPSKRPPWNPWCGRWEGQCNDLVALGVDREQLLNQSLISPSCGVGSLSLAQAQKVLALTRECRRIYVNSDNAFRPVPL